MNKFKIRFNFFILTYYFKQIFFYQKKPINYSNYYNIHNENRDFFKKRPTKKIL
jgi:hypothetical protein